MAFVDVAIPVPVHQLFTYAIPDSLRDRCQPGMRVVVPFRRQTRLGMVMARHATTPPMDCKSLLECCDEKPILDAGLLELCQWISRYYSAPIGEVCRTALPASFLRRSTLAGKPREPHVHRHDADFAQMEPITLTASQQTVVETISHAVEGGSFQTFLLHGITGSGKTEFYLQIIAQLLARGKSVLFLLPEIGLTPQLLGRIAHRFGETVALYHSGLTETQRTEQWLRMARGEARICCGTRSSVFAPLQQLGGIILDEEHDASYKQEEAPRYHGRDVAIVRAKLLKALVLLGSATPSLETYYNVQRHRYHLVSLTDRPAGATLPTVELIDMRDQPVSSDPSGLLSPPLRTAITETLNRREQVLLFLNRRGYAQMLLCRDCGAVFRCPNCDISLTLHRQAQQLRCHYCEYAISRPRTCAACQGLHLKTLGSGTEQIERALGVHFPQARIVRFDRDSTTERGARQQIVRAMRRAEIDILIGTQMVTKGHDFPGITLVGVIQADLSLHLPDFRAAERTFQLLTQVAGRAGRADRAGRVLIQTYTPDHYSLLCAQQHNYRDFVHAEVAHRQALGYPPFGRLVNVRCSSNSDTKAAEYAMQLRQALEQWTRGGSTITGILGPAPAPRSKVAGRHRWQLLCKAGDPQTVRALTEAIQQHINAHSPSGVTVAIDVDPLHMM
ncbi:MAG: primosomal protein N' [Deltaproteobacteria bacterium]|nr:primosomal protein N' [Deltaproteobacteria bacterium]